MNTEELIAAAEGLVKELQGRINGGGMDLQEAEAKILEMVNWIGDALVRANHEAVDKRFDAVDKRRQPDHGRRRGGSVRAGT
jgi:hypothetical protein